jgi:hypothetical protein
MLARNSHGASAAGSRALLALLCALAFADLDAAARDPRHACSTDEPGWITSGHLAYRLYAELAGPARWESATREAGVGVYGNLNPPIGRALIGAFVELAREPGQTIAYRWSFGPDFGQPLAEAALPPRALLDAVRRGIALLGVACLALAYASSSLLTGARWCALAAPLLLYLSPVFRAHASEVNLEIPQLFFLLAGVALVQRALARGSRAAGVCGLVALGLACSVRYHAAPVVAATAAFAAQGSGTARLRVARFAAAALIPLAVFVASAPVFWPSPIAMLRADLAEWSQHKEWQRNYRPFARFATRSPLHGLRWTLDHALLRPELRLPRLPSALPSAAIAAASLASASGIAIALAARGRRARARERPLIAYHTLCVAALALAIGLWLPLRWPRYLLPILGIAAPLAIAGLVSVGRLARHLLARSRTPDAA